jgi:hypothetical protein
VDWADRVSSGLKALKLNNAVVRHIDVDPIGYFDDGTPKDESDFHCSKYLMSLRECAVQPNVILIDGTMTGGLRKGGGPIAFVWRKA